MKRVDRYIYIFGNKHHSDFYQYSLGTNGIYCRQFNYLKSSEMHHIKSYLIIIYSFYLAIIMYLHLIHCTSTGIGKYSVQYLT